MGYVRLPRAAAEIEQVPRRRRVSENATLNLNQARNRRRAALGAALGAGVLHLQLLCERRLSRDGGQL